MRTVSLVVGMALGATSYEPVVNLEKLDLLYRKLRISPEHNFLYMTLPDSILDRAEKALRDLRAENTVYRALVGSGCAR